MPSPRKGEKEKEYVSRAIPMLMKEGTAKNSKQAVAIAHSMYKEKRKK